MRHVALMSVVLLSGCQGIAPGVTSVAGSAVPQIGLTAEAIGHEGGVVFAQALATLNDPARETAAATMLVETAAAMRAGRAMRAARWFAGEPAGGSYRVQGLLDGLLPETHTDISLGPVSTTVSTGGSGVSAGVDTPVATTQVAAGGGGVSAGVTTPVTTTNVSAGSGGVSAGVTTPVTGTSLSAGAGGVSAGASVGSGLGSVSAGLSGGGVSAGASVGGISAGVSTGGDVATGISTGGVSSGLTASVTSASPSPAAAGSEAANLWNALAPLDRQAAAQPLLALEAAVHARLKAALKAEAGFFPRAGADRNQPGGDGGYTIVSDFQENAGTDQGQLAVTRRFLPGDIPLEDQATFTGNSENLGITGSSTRTFLPDGTTKLAASVHVVLLGQGRDVTWTARAQQDGSASGSGTITRQDGSSLSFTWQTAADGTETWTTRDNAAGLTGTFTLGETDHEATGFFQAQDGVAATIRFRAEPEPAS